MMMPPSVKHALCALSLVSVAGCNVDGLLGGKTCTMELRSTITVAVTDARTGASAAVGSTVIVRGGALYDSVVVTRTLFGPNDAYTIFEDRTPAGRYSVEVRKPGYVTFTKIDVDVKDDGCHRGPGPAVQVALQPVP